MKKYFFNSTTGNVPIITHRLYLVTTLLLNFVSIYLIRWIHLINSVKVIKWKYKYVSED